MRIKFAVAVLALCTVPLCHLHCFATPIERVSTAFNGSDANGASFEPSISGDGRYVAFPSEATNLVAAPVPFGRHIYVFDRTTRLTELVDVRINGEPSDGSIVSSLTALSHDGRFVLFRVGLDGVVAGSFPPGMLGVCLRDRLLGSTELISILPDGSASDGFPGAISADGRFVSFVAAVGGAFVRDRQSASTTRVDVTVSGVAGDGNSFTSIVSSEGSKVFFASNSSDLVPSDRNSGLDIFVRDLISNETELVSLSPDGFQFNSASTFAVSDSGQYVAFLASSVFYPGTNTFVRDTLSGQTVAVTFTGPGLDPLTFAAGPLAISADGRLLSFISGVAQSGRLEVFLHDRVANSTQRYVQNQFGDFPNGSAHWLGMSADGEHIAFSSSASNLLGRNFEDINNLDDVFVAEVIIPSVTPTPSATVVPTISPTVSATPTPVPTSGPAADGQLEARIVSMPRAGVPGKRIRIKFEIENSSDVVIDSVAGEFMLSRDRLITPGRDRVLARRSLGTMEARLLLRKSTRVRLPRRLRSGRFFIGLRLSIPDASVMVSEQGTPNRIRVLSPVN